MIGSIRTPGPHQGQQVLVAGAAPAEATAAVILVHGRGATARGMFGLVNELPAETVTYAAPQAASQTWYPYSFLEPIERNEPWLTSALAAVGDVVDALADEGVPRERIVLLGFSQGACLSAEFVARNPQRYGGLIVFSGGLIGPPGLARNDVGDIAGTPVFIGGSDIDPHIPLERMQETAAILEQIGGKVDLRV
ncbi:MAG: alpha/beta hydrolase, partial [Thermomicrobiales bacterium]|nr:alpha/beta hydrolase [Thermomicrobiales bacterium]